MSTFKCQNCDWEGHEHEAPTARDLLMRLSPGDVFTDIECPKCGALVHPKATPTTPQGPRLKATSKGGVWLPAPLDYRKVMAHMSEELSSFCVLNGLPRMSADELVVGVLEWVPGLVGKDHADIMVQWLRDFGESWDLIQELVEQQRSEGWHD